MIPSQGYLSHFFLRAERSFWKFLSINIPASKVNASQGVRTVPGGRVGVRHVARGMKVFWRWVFLVLHLGAMGVLEI